VKSVYNVVVWRYYKKNGERTMNNGTGIFVNGGAYRPKWMKANQSRGTVHFAFSVEVPAGEEDDVVEELRESIRECVSAWSRSCWVKKTTA